MRFYGHGTVWDKERSKRLCTFDKNNELETEDERTIELLKQGGYLGDYDSDDFSKNVSEEKAEEKAEDVIDLESMSYADLRALCKERELSGYGKFSKEQLIVFLKENE